MTVWLESPRHAKRSCLWTTRRSLGLPAGLALMLCIVSPMKVAEAGTLPGMVSALNATASGADVVLSWSPVSGDVYWDPLSITSYNVYRGTDPNFVPDYAGGSNRVGTPTSAGFTDAGAGSAADSYFYSVTAVSADGDESPVPSNVAYKVRLDLTHDLAGTNRYWLGIPYDSAWSTASDLGGAAPNIGEVIAWDADAQAEVVYDVVAGTGTDFPLEPGHAYAVVITGDTTLDLVGASTATSRELGHATGRFNHHWLGLPVPSAAADADALAQSMDEVTKAARYDTANDTYQSWFELNGTWMGENFPIEPGMGVVVSVSAAAQFAPATGWPSATAEAVPDTGYESITVQLDGSASDVDGSIVRYQWDFEGDGVFDHDSAAGPAVQHTYYLPDAGPGTYRPTLLVTDDAGHRGIAFATLTLDTLNVDFSLDGFVPADGETVGIGYTLPQAGTVTVHIYDADGTLVATVTDGAAQAAGAQQALWDGTNTAGELVADGTYYAVIEYETGGHTSLFDTRPISGGVDITGSISDTSISGTLSPLEGEYVEVAYTLPENALVSIAVRDLSGTLIRQLLDEAPRAAGAQTEVWDGADDDGAIVPPGSSFRVQISSTSLASNSLIAQGLAPTISNLSAAPLRFSPASNPYGPQDDKELVIDFELNKPSDVTATVYDAAGTLVRTWVETDLGAGINQVSWSGRNDSGVLLANGTYRVELRATDAGGAVSAPFNVQTEIFY